MLKSSHHNTSKPVLYCFTKYTQAGPSSRYRTYQYLSELSQHFDIVVKPGFGDWYLQPGRSVFAKIFLLAGAFFKRWLAILALPFHSQVWLEYELFPYMPPIAEWILKKKKITYAVDYDDAIFHNYDRSKNPLVRRLLRIKIPWVMRHAHTVVTGSPYLTNFALQFNLRTIEIPTSVDIEKYGYSESSRFSRAGSPYVIGWLGSKTTSPNVAIVKQSLQQLAEKVPVQLWVMGYDSALKDVLAGLPVQFFSWSSSDEIAFLHAIDVGIMPLYDTPFNRGKCGFKLIQYMAAGKPTISTPLEANVKINRQGGNLFAKNDDEWFEAFMFFSEQKANRQMNCNSLNLEIVKKYYSKQANEQGLLDVLTSMNKAT